MRNGQGSNKYDKGQNNDERSAFGCAMTRMKELFHGVRVGLRGRDKNNVRTAEYRKWQGMASSHLRQACSAIDRPIVWKG